MGEADRQAELAKGQSHALEAPSWLWNSVVAAVGTHKSAYLQRCHDRALADAA